jgi:Carboxypeptidase regulatory-like domain
MGFMTRARQIAAVVLLASVAVLAGDKASNLQFEILKDENGKPVRNAEIVLHPVNKQGHQRDQGYELKTHADGKAQINGIPYGKLRVQVIAPGFRTYGEDFNINQPNHDFTIKLQKPAAQYSIYK